MDKKYIPLYPLNKGIKGYNVISIISYCVTENLLQ